MFTYYCTSLTQLWLCSIMYMYIHRIRVETAVRIVCGPPLLGYYLYVKGVTSALSM